MSSRRRTSSSRNSIKTLPMTASTTTAEAEHDGSSRSSHNHISGELQREQQHSAVVLQEVAASLNNNAVRMFRENQFDDSLMLYKQSLALLNNANFLLHRGDDEDAVSRRRNGAFFARKLSEVRDFNQPIEVPLTSTHLADVLMSNEEFVSTAVMYNLFLLLKASGHNEDALRFLELVHSIVRPSDEEASRQDKWHPSFRMVLQYHLGLFALECDEKESAWQLFIDAITIGKHQVPYQLLYAKLCTHVGGLLMEEQHLVQAQAAFEEAATVYQRSYTSQRDGFSDEDEDIELSPEDTFTAAAA